MRVFHADATKDIVVVGPEKIDFNRANREFTVELAVDEGLSGPRKMIEFYTRNNPDSIPYKKQTRDKLNLKHVDLVLRTPCIMYPDPRFDEEDHDIEARLIAQDANKVGSFLEYLLTIILFIEVYLSLTYNNLKSYENTIAYNVMKIQ